MTTFDRTAGPAFRPASRPASPKLFNRFFSRTPATHWLDIAAMLADVAFETDPLGEFAGFGQGTVLGIPAAQLIGRNISEFCRLTGNHHSVSNSFSPVFASLARQSNAWRGVVTLTRGDGGHGHYQIFLAPRLAEANGKNPRELAGAYGLLIDMNAPELQMLGPAAWRAVGMLDPQTGLWSATTFAEETGRRFDRLDVEGLPGTLLLLGFARTPAIGHHAVAMRLTQELRDVSRPTDILGRINATTFALWCDGMDDLTGAERAAKFCQRLPAALPGNPCISVGLVARWPGNMEDPQTLIARAAEALRQADQVAQTASEAGSEEPVTSGTWRVWNPQR